MSQSAEGNVSKNEAIYYCFFFFLIVRKSYFIQVKINKNTGWKKMSGDYVSRGSREFG